MITIFKASRKELWAVLSKAGVTGDLEWKHASREQMITIAVKNDIEEVPTISEDTELLKSLNKVFSPAFFKALKEVETKLSKLKTSNSVKVDDDYIDEDIDDYVDEDEPEPQPSTTVKKKLVLSYGVVDSLPHLESFKWWGDLHSSCQEFIMSHVGVTAENVQHYIEVSDIPFEELQLFVNELVCFEEIHAADKANDEHITLANTVMDDREETEYFNWYTSMFGKDFPLIQTPQKSINKDKLDVTHTNIVELRGIRHNNKQGRFPATTSKLLSFTVPATSTILVEDFFKLTMAIRKAQYLGCTIKFTPNT